MTRRLTGAVLWLSGLVVLGNLAGQTDFAIILAGASLCFGGYALLSSEFSSVRSALFLGTLAFAGRMLLFPVLPLLSDDIYRFIWDGMLQIDGIPLLEATPTHLMEKGQLPATVYSELYPLLNSPDYLTIYPPLIQWMNAVAVYLAGGSVLVFAVIIRSFMLVSDLISAMLIWQIGKGKGLGHEAAFWWLLNPLLVIETTGNLHAEGFVVTCLLATWYWLGRKKVLWGALCFAMAVLFKLHPLMLFPLILLNLGWKNGIRFLVGSLAVIVLAFSIAYGSDVFQLNSSIGLYFQNFEFNAGIYYLLRAIITWQIGYNPIQWLGPAMAAFSAVLILVISWRYRRNNNMLEGAGWIYAGYLLLSTTVHPWYILIPFGLMLFSSYRITMTGWTFLVILSYSHYWGNANSPDWGLTIAEYTLLFILFWINRMHLKTGSAK